MRKSIIAALSLLSAGSALAADLARVPMYAPAPPVLIDPWTGFYVGGNIGGGWAQGSSDFGILGGPVFATANNYLSGVVGGGQVGYNFRSGPILFGAEADLDAANVSGTLNTPCVLALCGLPLSASFTQNVPWFGTVRGRIGYATDSWVVYATGGYAFVRLDTTATAMAGPLIASFSQNEMRNGWTFGGGVEVAFAPHWSAKAEYLYMDLGSTTTNFVAAGLPTITDTARLNMNVVRAGVNYHF